MIRTILIFIILLLNVNVWATHNRAGEITYEQLSEYEYKVTIVTYTYAPSPADRNELEVIWGDGTTSIVPRIIEELLPDDYKRNVYVGTHIFSGPGTYEIVVEDPNRNYGVENIPNSVNVVFSVKTTLLINPYIGTNNTPVLTNAPIDKAAVGHVFIHNPGAFDPDGDSLSYKLTTCTGPGGEPIVNYTLPNAANSFTINEITGDMIWDYPVDPGIYNVAILIEEWREGVRIGKLIRDMQIEVYESDNNPPIIEAPDEICIGVDSVINIEVKAYDSDGDLVYLSARGGVLELESQSGYFTDTSSYDTVYSSLIWESKCMHVRKQPYYVVFKAEDSHDYDVSLVDMHTLAIEVMGPAPENLTLTPTSNSVKLNWDASYCTEAVGYKIYRRTGYINYIPDDCVGGVPSETGYQLIAEVEGNNTTEFIDNNNGEGLVQGFDYCYMVTAIFPDGAEGYPSKEECTELVKGIPVITNVSIRSTDDTDGSLLLAWSKPTDFDTEYAPGPYKYLIYRSTGIWGENLQLIDSTQNENDTIYIDSLLNTVDNPYSYSVEFINNEPGNRFVIGNPGVASSVYIKLFPSDNEINIQWQKNVPWINNKYVIYKYNNGILDSISQTTQLSYKDVGLTNGLNYCYQIKSVGDYPSGSFISPIINYSQYSCGIPKDTIPPCDLDFNVETFCDSLYNYISWNNVTACADDALMYRIYYARDKNTELTLLDTITDLNQTTYYHYPELSLAGCYKVTAVDSFYNETSNPYKICVDNCDFYQLPNVFTPNGDGQWDIYGPNVNKFVEKVNFKVYNRWGQLMFETEDPNLNWDGKNMNTGKTVTDGVYFYICDIYERRISGLEMRNKTGFIHVFSKVNEDYNPQDY